MPHYRARYSRKYFTHVDLPEGNEVESELLVRIARVETGTLKNEQGTAEQKPFLFLEGHDKPLGCNVTNGSVIAALYGDDDSAWPGKFITLYRTKASFAGRMVDCIRVRPVVPRLEAEKTPAKRARKAA
jgi:hypothetical protein